LPPLHPPKLLLGNFAHDTSYYSENCLNLPFLMASKDSKTLIVANAQHAPQDN